MKALFTLLTFCFGLNLYSQQIPPSLYLKPDTIRWKYFDEFNFSAKLNTELNAYKSNKQQLDSVLFARKNNETWDTSYSTIFHYDNNSLTLKQQNQYLITDTSRKLTNQTNYEFDEFGNNNYQEVLIWVDSLNGLIKDWKRESVFKKNGIKLLEKRFVWNQETTQWLCYDSIIGEIENDLLSSEIRYWDGTYKGNLKLSSKTIFDYNSDKHLTSETRYRPNEDTTDWIPASKIAYKYDASNLKTTEDQIYSSSEKKFLASSIYYHYYYNHTLTQQKGYGLNKLGDYSDTTLSSIHYYGFDNLGNPLMSERVSFIDNDTNYHSLNIFLYNQDNEIKDILMPPVEWFGPGTIRHIIVLSKSIVSQIKESLHIENGDSTKYIYYYSDRITNVKSIENLTPIIYPNPTQDYLQINSAFENALFHLINNNGKTVLSKHFSGKFKIDISNLKPGLYIAKIQRQRNSYSQKIVIE